MDDFIYEEIGVNGRGVNLSLGILTKERLFNSARVKIYNTDAFGRALYLDGSLQTCEKYEAAYHESLVHVPYTCIGQMKSVLIIGGGDGGTLREVLKYKEVERVVFCEINPIVIEACKEHLPFTELTKNLADPRVSLVYKDGAEFIKEVDGSFDAILVDCSDPTGEALSLYTREFFTDCYNKLTDEGVIAIQSANVFIAEKFVRFVRYELNRLFKSSFYHYTPIPSYPGGGVGFYIATKDSPWNRMVPPDIAFSFSGLTMESVYSGRHIVPPSFERMKKLSILHDYNKDIFDWAKYLSKKEFQFIQFACPFEDEPRDENKTLPLFSYGYNVDKGVVSHTLFVGSIENSQNLALSVYLVLSERKISLKGFEEGVCGIRWDTKDNSIEFFFPQAIKDEARYERGLLGKKYVGDKIETTIYSWDLTKAYSSCDNKEEEKVRVRTNFDTWEKRLSNPAKKVLDFSKNRLTLEAVSYVSDKQFQLLFEAVI